MRQKMEFTLDELRTQSARLAAQIDQSSRESESTKQEITHLEHELDQAERMELRTGDETLRREAEQRLTEARAKLARLIEHGRKAHHESGRCDMELRHAENVARQARIARATALSDAVFAKLAGDRKARAELLSGVALLMVGHQNMSLGNWDWPGILADVFKIPDGDELGPHLEAAKKALA
jgi:chromosome segregation ATPase